MRDRESEKREPASYVRCNPDAIVVQLAGCVRVCEREGGHRPDDVGEEDRDRSSRERKRERERVGTDPTMSEKKIETTSLCSGSTCREVESKQREREFFIDNLLARIHFII